MNRLTIAIVAGTALAAFGCSKQEPVGTAKVTAETVRKETKEAAGATAQYVEREKDEFVRAAQNELDRFRYQLAQLKSQAQTATGEAKTKLDAQVARLEVQWQAAEARLAELKSAGAGKWREAKANLTQELDELKQSFGRNQQERKQG